MNGGFDTVRTSSFRRRIGSIGLVAGLALSVSGLILATPPAHAAGGPVILGGDDLTEHGSRNNTTNTNEDGWLYLEKAIENVSPVVTRPGNNGSIAALGSADSTSSSGNAGAAIHFAAQDAGGKSVTYYDTATAVDGFFAALRAGTTNPAIIWIAGDDATNDLDTAESTSLANNATTIGDFVNSGGGLISHGTEYAWLSGLLPGATAPASGATSDLVLTPQGTQAFPGLTNADVNAGPWHNHFEGNLGNLQVLVESTSVTCKTACGTRAIGARAPVIIGGAAVTLPGSIDLTPATAQQTIGSSHTVTATVRNNQGALRPGATVTFTVTAGPNSGKTGTGTTDANGQVPFTYTDTGTGGTDTIQASVQDEAGATRSTTANVTWAAAGATTTTTTTAPGATTTTTTAPGATTTTTAPAATTTTTTAVAAACNTQESVASVAPTTAKPGGTVAVAGACFSANQTLNQVFESVPVNLGTTRSDAAGRYANTIVVPLSADPGTHRIVTSGLNPSGTQHRSIGLIVIGDLNCTDFAAREDAQAVLNANRADPHGLDTNHDGIACETLPLRVSGFGVTGASTRNQVLFAGLAIMLGSALVIAGRRPWLVVSASATRLNELLQNH